MRSQIQREKRRRRLCETNDIQQAPQTPDAGWPTTEIQVEEGQNINMYDTIVIFKKVNNK